MTKLRLISHRLCPYVQRAVIVLDEKGAAFEREDIDLGNKPEWFLKLSPLGKVPLLTVEENGRTEVIFESAVIAEYLDETIEPRLHPQAAIERARHRAWIEFASATLADVAGFYAASDEEQFTSKRDSLEAKFARVEEALGEGPWFAGPEFSIVDAAFAPVFRYFDTFDSLVEHGVFHAKPKVSAWRSALRDRPSVRKAVSPDYHDGLRAFLSARGSYLGDRVDAAAA
jgi:glutathione S-transferase